MTKANQTVAMVVVAGLIALLPASAQAGCVHTGFVRGTLTRSQIVELASQFVELRREWGPDTRFLVYQSREGHHVKFCDNPLQQAAFQAVYGYLSSRYVTLDVVCSKQDIAKFAGKPGLFRISKTTNGCFLVEKMV
jgi:hypothetical protein